MSADKDIDWVGIEAEYLAGVKSLRAIGREYGVSDGGIRKKAKTDNWGDRNPSGIKAELVKAHFAGKPSSPNGSNGNGSHLSGKKKKATPDRVLAAQKPTPTAITPQIAEENAQYAPPRSRTVRPSRMRAAQSIEEAAQQDIQDMELALTNAREALWLVQDGLAALNELNEWLTGPNMGGDGEDNLRGFRMLMESNTKSLKALLDTNQSAIDQIRRIRNLDGPAQKLDEMEAFKALAMKGWIPEELLAAIYKEYSRMKPTIKSTFRAHLQLSQGAGNVAG